MVQQRKQPKRAKDIKLSQPDRTGPTEQTLLGLAQDRDLFKQADEKERQIKKQKAKEENTEYEDDEDALSPAAERIMDTVLYTVCLAMLHFTLDVLVQHQYAVEINWFSITKRSLLALIVFATLIYPLHPHSSNPTLLPGLPSKYQPILRQAIFFTTSLAAGCYLIHITNKYSYLAVLKEAPSIGCLWVWSIIELNLGMAVVSLGAAGVFLKQQGYTIK